MTGACYRNHKIKRNVPFLVGVAMSGLVGTAVLVTAAIGAAVVLIRALVRRDHDGSAGAGFWGVVAAIGVCALVALLVRHC